MTSALNVNAERSGQARVNGLSLLRNLGHNFIIAQHQAGVALKRRSCLGIKVGEGFQVSRFSFFFFFFFFFGTMVGETLRGGNVSAQLPRLVVVGGLNNIPPDFYPAYRCA